MDKMRMESPDGVQLNVEKIATLFPNCVTEAKGEDGKLRKVIDFDLLRQMLSGEVIEGDEAYEFASELTGLSMDALAELTDDIYNK